MQHESILKNILAIFELSDNCEQIYIKSFELGEMSVGELARGLKMDRSSAYLAIEQLKRSGLIELNENKRPMTILAVEPRRILGRIDSKLQDLEETLDITHNFLPQLEAVYKSKNARPVMQSYVGKDGLQQVMEDILNGEATELLIFTNQSKEKEVFTKHDHEYFIRKRKQNNLYARVIATEDEYSKKMQSEDGENKRVTKILKGPTPFSCETYIYQDKVAMFIFRDEILAFIVDSSDFTQLMHWQFETIWATL